MNVSIFKYLFFVFIIAVLPITTRAASSSINIGQRFILSLPEGMKRAKLKQWLAHTKPGGVMLLASHFTTRAELAQLISFLRSETKKLGLPHLYICIDQEPGIVARGNETAGFYSVPSSWALAAAGRSSCFQAGMLIGHQLRAIGVDINFAPSLDLFDQNNHILATRTFSSNPDIVALFGIAFGKGLLSQDVMPVIKHFPGLAGGKQDTHMAQTHLKLNAQELEYHMSPFLKSLEAGMPIVMCTHATHKFFGSGPITLSSSVVKFLKQKNKDALVITDDFCMKAVHIKNTLEATALQSLLAGFDMIIYSAKPQEQIALIQNLQALVDALSLSKKNTLREGQLFVNHFKITHKAGAVDREYPYVHEAHLSLKLAEHCFKSPQNYATLYGKNRVAVISIDLLKIRPPEKWFMTNEHSYVGQLLKDQGKQVKECILNPCDVASTKKLKQFCAALAKDEPIIIQTFFFADTASNPLQCEWLKVLKPYQERVIVFSLGHPCEQNILSRASVITLGSYNKPLLTHAVRFVCGAPELTGSDRLVANPELYLAGKKIGLACHAASVVQPTCTFLPDVLYEWTTQQKDGTKLAALFSPEHGLKGTVEAAAHVDSQRVSPWECPVYSLHGKYKKPTPEMLAGLDILVIDFQEVGVRCFTYLSSMKLLLEAAAEIKLPVLVLDRPNPLAWWQKLGPVLEPAHESFLGKLYVPFLHGKTIGELALECNKSIGADLTVLVCCTKGTMYHQIHKRRPKDKQHEYFFTHRFVAPSPNLMTIDHVFAYPLSVFFEGTNYSEGRGTRYPFLQVGAPWVDSNAFADALNAVHVEGIYFEPISFTPQAMLGIADNPKHKDSLCHGVFIHITDYDAVDPMYTAHTMLQTAMSMYPQESQWIKFGKTYVIDQLVGSDAWRKEIDGFLQK